MRIAVITMHAVKNYGSVLQTYATQEVLRKKQHDMFVINYIRKKNLNHNLVDTWTRNDKGIKKVLKTIIIWPTVKKWCKVFDTYLNENIIQSPYVYLTEEDFKKHPVVADIYCTGSDQVWNSGWNEGIEKPFFLTFAPKGSKKIAIAASVGKSELSSNELNEILPYLKEYKSISVREKSTAIFLKNHGVDNVEFCLDPTLLLSRKEWLDHSTPYKKKLSKYILIYQLNHDSKFDEFAVEVAKRLQLPLLRVCTRYDQVRLPGKPIVIPKVQELISLFNEAELVLTNSFHATAFCINLNTKFISINPNEYSCRITDVLQLFGLEDRRVRSYTDYSMIEKKIDYERVNMILDEERKKSLHLIDEMIGDVNKDIK